MVPTLERTQTAGRCQSAFSELNAALASIFRHVGKNAEITVSLLQSCRGPLAGFRAYPVFTGPVFSAHQSAHKIRSGAGNSSQTVSTLQFRLGTGDWKGLAGNQASR